MPFDRDIAPLNHILTEIRLAESFLAGMTFEDFRSDPLRYRAIIRCLEVISEASRRLSPDFKSRHPHLAWREIAGAGNVYRHDYEDLTDQQIWRTAQTLGPLRRTVELELAGNAG